MRSTRIVGEAIAQAARPPRVWLQASTATIYAHRYDAPNDERTGILGGRESDAPGTWRFSIDVARAWEQAFEEAVDRSNPEGCASVGDDAESGSGRRVRHAARAVRRGLGGRAGDGRQFMSWIHDEDFVSAVQWLIDRDDIEGVVNVAVSNPLPNAEFMRVLREACGVPFGLPASRWMLEIGAVFMRTETELILKSRRVVPARLLEHGFTFRFPHWSDAARDLCDRWRVRNLRTNVGLTPGASGPLRKQSGNHHVHDEARVARERPAAAVDE